ncbi:MAG TPA: YggS family pyridoxal phosphate-dependent enzyme, partial [Brumimicrobium sp.]|nr:YggS family pyridoxal phosphate-dependent enzyme [Brumimicrobium sp.]
MIAENLAKIKSTIPNHVQLIAVSKTKPVEDILEAYHTGHKVFGENRVQELADKYEALPKDIEWHMIGYLQSNKVKYIAPFVHLIHGVHSLKLLEEINKRAKNEERTINVLLQFHIAEEDTKSGFSFEEVKDLLESDVLLSLENIAIKGVMGMATFTDDAEKIRDEFRTLNNYFLTLKGHFFKYNEEFS